MWRSRFSTALGVGLVLALASCGGGGTQTEAAPGAKLGSGHQRVLVFSRTLGFRHDSIPAGIAALRQLGSKHGFSVTATEDPGAFTTKRLRRFDAVVFLSTTGDVLGPSRQRALRRYVNRGGGFAGVHAAADTEYDWPFYGRLLGARFSSHPAIQPATVRIEDDDHRSTQALPPAWSRTDEWYGFRSNPRQKVHVLATVDEATYLGGTMGADHPIAWCRRVGRGRSWYTALGHTKESFSEPLFLSHLLGGVLWAAGKGATGCHPG